MASMRLVPVDKTLVRVKLFGAVEARSVLDVNVLPRSRRARAILAYLLLSEDDVVPRKRFGPLLWSTRYPEQQQTSARQAVRELKAALSKVSPRVITVQRDTIRVNRAAIWIDGLSRRADAKDDPNPQPKVDPDTFLETLVGLDAPFDAWIKAMRAQLTAVARPVAHPLQPAPIHGGIRAPRLDIMPFASFGEDDGNRHVAQALTHELATGLSRFRWVAVRMGQTGASGSADYRIEGHIAHGPDGGRLTVRLIEARTDQIAWPHAETLATPLRPAAIAAIAE